MNKSTKEIEVKVKVKDFTKILAALNKLGCKFSPPINQEDTIYLEKGTGFTQITTDTNVLRIRKQNDKNFLTLKRNSVNSLIKIEKETLIENSAPMDEILQYMNYVPVIKIKKQRRKCKYKSMEICLDTVVGLGNFVEVERISANDPIKIQDALISFLKSLGINMDDRVFYGYDILAYLKAHPEHQNKF